MGCILDSVVRHIFLDEVTSNLRPKRHEGAELSFGKSNSMQIDLEAHENLSVLGVQKQCSTI